MCGIGVRRGLYGGGWTGCIANHLHSCYLTRGLRRSHSPSCSIHVWFWLSFPNRENTLTIPLLCSVLNCPRWKCFVLFWVISRMTTRLIAHPTTTLKTSSIWGSFRRPWLITFKSATLTSCVNRIKCARPEPFSLSILIQEMGGWRHRTSLLKAFPLWWLSPAWRLIIFCRKSWVNFSESRNVILLRVKSLLKRFNCVLHDSFETLQKWFPIWPARFNCVNLICFLTLILNNRNRFLNSRVTRCLSKLSGFRHRFHEILVSGMQSQKLRHFIWQQPFFKPPFKRYVPLFLFVAVGQPSLCNIRNASSYSTGVSFSFWRRASKLTSHRFPRAI